MGRHVKHWIIEYEYLFGFNYVEVINKFHDDPNVEYYCAAALHKGYSRFKVWVKFTEGRLLTDLVHYKHDDLVSSYMPIKNYLTVIKFLMGQPGEVYYNFNYEKFRDHQILSKGEMTYRPPSVEKKTSPCLSGACDGSNKCIRSISTSTLVDSPIKTVDEDPSPGLIPPTSPIRVSGVKRKRIFKPRRQTKK